MRSVFFNVFQSLIVVLYVLDNETNFVVRCSVIIGLGIEIWKIHKVTDIEVGIEGLNSATFSSERPLQNQKPYSSHVILPVMKDHVLTLKVLITAKVASI